MILAALLLAAAMSTTTLLASPSYACACGAAVPPDGARATLNHEAALVHWDGTTETIVMQLTMNASTNNVALVVPTPKPATVTSGDKATFSELDSLTAPQVQQRKHWKLGSLFALSAPKAAAPTGAPNVLSQVHLGPLEATTLAGGDLSGLQKWLSDNGYAIKPAITDALGPYVHDGWAFVAMRLTSTADLDGGLSPVRMSFASSQLVYPMRLSVAAPSPQQVTVYTLSEHRQQRIDPDASAQAGQSTQVQFAGNIATAAQDSLLRELVGNHGAYLTKVEVNIPAPAKISSDFLFGNATNDDTYRQIVYADHDVVIPIEFVAVGTFVFVLIVGAVTTVIVVVTRRRRRRITALR